jgi:hypothetical protein
MFTFGSDILAPTWMILLFGAGGGPCSQSGMAREGGRGCCGHVRSRGVALVAGCVLWLRAVVALDVVG